MSDKTIFTTTEAAEYLGLHRETFKYHLEQGHLAPDEQLSSGFVFTRATLETFKDRHQTEGLTLLEAAAHLGVSENWMMNRIYTTGELVPDGKLGRMIIFKAATLEAIRPLVGQPRRRKPKG